MYLYFSSNGTLKEIVNDSAIRQGNSGINTIKIFIEGADPATDSNGVYQALTFASGARTFIDVEGNNLTTESFSLSVTEETIPFNKKRELKYFKYWTEYEMFSITVPDDILNESGTVGCRITLTNTDSTLLVLGLIVFNVEITGGEAIISQDTAINIAQWNYLLANMATLTTVAGLYVPYTGATTNVDLDDYTLNAADILVDGTSIASIYVKLSADNTISGDNVFSGDTTLNDCSFAGDIYVDGGANHDNTIDIDSHVDINFGNLVLQAGSDTLQINGDDVATQEWVNDNSVSKTSSINKVYATDSSGNQITIDYDTLVNGQIVRRVDSNSGNIYVGTPTAMNHATPKSYVDNLLSAKEDVSNKVTSLSNASTDTQYPSAKVVYDNLVNVREVAEGKCKTFVLSYAETITDVKNIAQYITICNVAGDDITNAILNGDYDNYSFVNSSFNSQNDQVGLIGMDSYYIILNGGYYNFHGYVVDTVLNFRSSLKVGDIILITQTNVPDRWYGGQSGGTSLFLKLETTKVDLTNYYAKNVNLIPATTNTYDIGSSTNTWKDLYLSGNLSDGTNSISVSELSQNLIEVTYAELVTLVNNSELKPGYFYRITDYVTKVNGVYDLSAIGQQGLHLPYATSAEHPFDLIVCALSENELDEHATAIQHDGDTYFSNSNLSAWDIKYTIENDATKYSWADATNGKGTITFMRDEFNNEAYYDFKNIMNLQFALRRTDSTSDTGESFEYNASSQPNRYGGLYDVFILLLDNSPIGGNLEFDVSSLNGTSAILLLTFITDVKKETLDSAMNWTYLLAGLSQMMGTTVDLATLASLLGTTEQVLSAMTERQVIQQFFNGDFYYTFDDYDDGTHSDYSLVGGYCHDNKIGHCADALTLFLSNSTPEITVTPNGLNVITFENNSVTTYHGAFGNKIGNNSFLCVFGSNTYSNNLKDWNYAVKFGNNCYYNMLGNSCNNNIFGNNCYYNTFSNACSSNYFGNGSHSNTFGDYCHNNTFGNDCVYNTFGGGCLGILFGTSCSFNTFGNSCNNNIFGTSSSTINHCQNNIFDSGCSYIYLSSADTTASSSNQLQNVHIHLGVAGSSSANMLSIVVPDRNLAYSTDYYANNSQTIILD